MGLAAITQLVDDKLRSAALGEDLAPAAVRDRAIGQAVLQYSLDAPQRLHEDVADPGGWVLPLPADWVAGRSTLTAVENPVGYAPMRVLDAAVLLNIAGDGLQVVLADEVIASGQTRIHFTAPHVVDDSGSTVPVQHENAVACWAAAELCRQLATQKGHERDGTIGAAAVNTATASGDLARRSRDWFTEYRQVLGLPDPAAQPGPQGASAVVNLRGDDRPRPRFYSSGAW